MFVKGGISPSSSPIRISQIDPASPVFFQHSSNLTEKQNETFGVCFGGIFQPDLPVHSVVTKAVVRRTGNNAVDRLAGKCLDGFKTISEVNFIQFHLFQIVVLMVS